MIIPFNLKKYAQLNPINPELPAEQDNLSVPQSGQDIETIADPMEEQQQFSQEQNQVPQTHEQLKQLLETMGSFDNAWNWYSQQVGDNETSVIEETGESVNSRQFAKPALETFFDPMLEQDPEKEEKKLDAAHSVFETLPQNNQGAVMANYQQGPSISQNINQNASINYEQMVKYFNNHIENLAKIHVANKSKVFNLQKTAQAKTIDNVMVWGPGEKRFDPFLRQPVSDWHIVERNKGYGITIDDRWNIDWEAIWRGNIMDKYSRPYRDKDGNWIGGYIEKRFEVDKNIPEMNNYQLKPGQRRRPIVPEHGITERRLESSREKGNIPYTPNTKDVPFNWNTAKTNEKLTKQAYKEDLFNVLAQNEERLNKVSSLYSLGEFSKAYKLAGVDENNTEVKAKFVSDLYDYKLSQENKKKSKLAQLKPILPLGSPSKPGPKGFLEPQKKINAQYKCSVCNAQIGSTHSINCKDDCRKNNGMPYPWSQVAVLTGYKNAPDKPGKQTSPTPLKSLNMPLSTNSSILFDSNTKRYILAQLPFPAASAEPLPPFPTQSPILPAKKKKPTPKIIQAPEYPRVSEDFTSPTFGDVDNKEGDDSKDMREGDMVEPIKRVIPGNYRNNTQKVEYTDGKEGYLHHEEASRVANDLGIDG